MALTVEKIKLGSHGLEVSKQGLGCMGMSSGYGLPKPEPEMISLIHHAINSGVTFLDTSDFYGPHTNELLIGKDLRHLLRILNKRVNDNTGRVSGVVTPTLKSVTKSIKEASIMSKCGYYVCNVL